MTEPEDSHRPGGSADETKSASADPPNTTSAQPVARNADAPTVLTAQPAVPHAIATLPASRLPEPGDFIKHYEIIRLLGIGGMGAVFKARDTKLGRLVALKLLTKLSDRRVKQFLDEAKKTALFNDANIVIIHDMDEHHGCPYMVLEYIEGQSLREWMEEYRATNQDPKASRARVPASLAVELMVPVVRALCCAHEQGIVHCDLKPDNVMLGASGPIKVLDFGIAKLSEGAVVAMATVDRALLAGDLAEVGRVVGTLPYMCPEQWGKGEIDARTDLWAAGVMLYDLVTGAHPLAPYDQLKLAKVCVLDEPMPKVGDALPGLGPLAAVIDRCLRKRKEERFASAEELLAALESMRRMKSGPPGEGESPFTGLASFLEVDAPRFFGREREVISALGMLRHHALLAIVRPSGAGKSSFVRAGLIPALKSSGEGWEACTVRPGRHPLASLVEGCASVAPEVKPSLSVLREEPWQLGAVLRAHCHEATCRILLFVDQLEELYTLGADQAERAAFLACLTGVADDASSPLRVALTIRSDFLDRLAEDRLLMSKVADGRLLLQPMGTDGLREALTRPVEAAGHRFESEGMVDAILGELAHTRSPLPLLQCTAAALWEARDRERRLLTLDSYEKLGGVAGALSTHADAVLAGFSPLEQRLCRAVLLRLCTPERTRVSASLSALRDSAEDGRAMEQVVERLADARLLLLETINEREDKTVELIHESLIERWATLKQWLDESEQDAQFLGRLRAAAQQWEASGKARGLLWRDREAQEAEAWLERRRVEHGPESRLAIGKREERFLVAVAALAERSRRMQRWLVAEVLFALVIAIVVALLVATAQENDRRREVLAANEYTARWVAGTVLYKLREYHDATVQAANHFPPEFFEELRQTDIREGDVLEGYCWELDTRHNEPGSSYLPFDGWFILGKEGRIRARWPPTPVEYLGRDYSWRDYFKGAWKLGEAGSRSAYVSRPHISEGTLRQRFTLSAPVYDRKGEPIGVIVAMTDAGATMGTLQLRDPKDRGHIAMVVALPDNDREHKDDRLPLDHVILVHDSLPYGQTTTLKKSALIHETIAMAEKDNPDRGLKQLLLTEPTTVKSYEGYCDPVMDGDCDQVAPHAGRWLAGFAPVGNTGFVAIVETPRDAAARPNETLAGRFLLWAGLPFAAGTLVLGFAVEIARRRSARKYR